ncbi:MAG: SUMF1/EgtB/PvdO family nonheme iron enzyme [Saprospiraceae bacterium]
MNIFIAFANQDRDVRDKLLRQMNLVKDRQGWNIWSAKEIKAGERWGEEIERRLLDSEVIVLLLSADFFSSDYIMDKELPKVVEKHKAGDCQIIPVLARQCHWKDTPFGEYAELGDIQALPVGEKPIVSRGHWDNDDQPYYEVVEGVKDSIRAFQAKKRGQVEAANLAEEAKRAKEADQRAREADARARTEREHRDAEQRTRDEQARREREETQRAENEHLAAEAQRAKDAERQRQQEARRADQTAWQHAADAHNTDAYQTYLAHYPQGEMAREARFRIKELKRQEAAPVPWGRYAAIGGGALAVFLLVWLGMMWFGGEGESQLPESSKLSGSSTTQNQPITTEKKSGLEMVAIQGGTFQMGSPASEEGRDDDECQHSVMVDDFSIGKHEVTQADWREIMGSDPPELNFKGCDDCPVESVSWNDVQDFLKALNAKYPGKTYRLPTEAEWEYAARGGSKSQRYKYAGSDNLGSVAWYSENSGSKTNPVGGKAHNELGLYDMSGNVWEWCQDTWKPYPCDGKTTADGRYRVFRGGSAFRNAVRCRAANRDLNGAAGRNLALGFRLCSVSLQ